MLRRSSAIVSVAVGVIALAASCASGPAGTSSTGGDASAPAVSASASAPGAIPESGDARARVGALRTRFATTPMTPPGALRRHGVTIGPQVAPAPRPAIGRGIATGFEEVDASHVRPVIPSAAKRAVLRSATVTLPKSANDAVTVEDDTTHVAVKFALRGATDAKVEVADGVAVYPGAYRGGDVVHRAHAEGTEDYVVFGEKPGEEAIEYDVDVTRVAGLRLVSNVLEFLDEGGAPRVRVGRPYVVYAKGGREEAKIGVDGCAVDVNPAGPWGREVTRAGAGSCRVRVSWRSGMYPALLDPPWTATGSMTIEREVHTATLLTSGPNASKVLIVGGYSGGFLSSAEFFDGTSSFAATGSMTAERGYHTATLLTLGPNAGHVLIAGGLGLSSAELFDGTSSFAATGSMTAERYEHTATLLTSGPNAGHVLIAGGEGNTHSSAELFDGTSSFAATGSMTAGRDGHTATLLTSGPNAGHVLITGGEGNDFLSSAELFDGTSSFAATGSMTAERGYHTATLLTLGPNAGHVLVAGGSNGDSYLSSAELFDGTSSFAATGSMTAGRDGHTATLLTFGPSAGNVLLAGGYDYGAQSSAELFDGTSSFAATGSMTAERGYHTATLLTLGPNAGSVLIAGGLDNNNDTILSSAELFAFVGGGGSCSLGTECASGICDEGICCASQCPNGGICQQCSGDAGACQPVINAQDPATCTGTSSCNASAECVLATGQPCPSGAATCATDLCVQGYCCNLACNGTCQVCAQSSGAAANGICTTLPTNAQPSTPCAPGYACDGASPNCPTSCTSNGQCSTPTYACSAGGSCLLAIGQPCSADAACATGSCADGYCCNTPCSGSCDVCSAALGLTSNGTCVAAFIGYVGNPSCGPSFVCNGTSPTCDNPCLTDKDCATGTYCDATGACVPEKTASSDSTCNLAASTSGGDCEQANCRECGPSGNCIDGYCCNTTCPNSCDACNGAAQSWPGATNGTCATAPEGYAGSPACSAVACNGVTAACPGTAAKCSFDLDCEPGDYCATGGSCQPRKSQGAQCNDAAGQDCLVAGCRECNTGAGHCVDGFCCDTTCGAACDACNGATQGWAGAQNGTCADAPRGYAGGPTCAPNVCQGGSASCGTSCALDNQCASTAFCRQSDAGVGACTTTEGLGTPCSGLDQCASGYCVDGVCCNNACAGTCMACAAALKQSGIADGTCDFASSTQDPHDNCTAAAPASCQLDGLCDGTGHCADYPVGAACGSVTCINNAATGSICNGSGTCIVSSSGADGGGGQLCTPFACQSTTGCPASCATDGDCLQPGYWCTGGACVAKVTNGGSCATTSPDACLSGNCVDAVCCDHACNGTCQTCLAKNQTIGPDGGAPHDGTCGAATGSTCAPAACVSGAVQTSACTSAGTCVATTTSCGAYACAGGACEAACTTNADCATGDYCSAGICAAQTPQGGTCTGDAQCATGFVCADGVCCNSTCTGLCESCNATGTAGTCAPVVGAAPSSHGTCPAGTATNPCAQAQCDGINATTCNGFAGPSVSCGAASCVDGGAQPIGACDGTGACKLPPVSSCGNFACEGTTCVKTCTTISDCAPGNTCAAGVCASGATCDGNHTITGATGQTTDCSPYKCNQSGACSKPCSSVADCVTPDVCNASSDLPTHVDGLLAEHPATYTLVALVALPAEFSDEDLSLAIPS